MQIAATPTTFGGITNTQLWARLNNLTTQFSVGYTFLAHDNGIQSSGTLTPDPALGNYQFVTNNGAFILAAPSSDCAIDLMITNAAAAGAITFSGFTVGASTGRRLDDGEHQLVPNQHPSHKWSGVVRRHGIAIGTLQ